MGERETSTPDAAATPISDAHRSAALDHLRAAAARTDLDLDDFSAASSAIVAAGTLAELTGVLDTVAPVVRMTPPARRLSEPLVLETRSGRLEMVSSWQVARETRVACVSGRVLLDLTAAEFDDVVVDLELRCRSGTIEVIVPAHVDVQMVRMTGESGRVVNRLPANGLLPAPVCVRVKAKARSGRIVLRPPTEPAPAGGRRWFRRRGSS